MERIFKAPINHTQQQALKAQATVAKVMRTAHISYSEWLDLFFEIGWQFVHKYVVGDLREHLLKNEGYGFWAWFMGGYIHDDQNVLAYIIHDTETTYLSEKMRITFLKSFYEDLQYFLTGIPNTIATNIYVSEEI